jgi:hypothetical protein
VRREGNREARTEIKEVEGGRKGWREAEKGWREAGRGEGGKLEGWREVGRRRGR